jgi:hypothetical protein
LHTKERAAIGELLIRKSLNDLLSLLKVIEIWDKSDEKKAKNLITKRNGIAHHNSEVISTHFNSGKNINTAQVNEVVEKDKNTHIVIVDALELIFKIISN